MSLNRAKPYSPIAITGIGAVSPSGIGVLALFEQALRGETSIHKGLGHISKADQDAIFSKFPDLATESTAVAYAVVAIQEAIEQAKWTQILPTDGLILGTTTGQISMWEPSLLAFLSNVQTVEEFSGPFSEQSLGLTLSQVAERFGFTGPTLLTTSACSASTQALAMAGAWLQSGKVKRCLVGGTEVLSELTVQGFRSLQLLSDKRCTPFQEGRVGINLSEAAAFLCLETVNEPAPHALAYLSGFGMSTDAYHLASPHPEGAGMIRAMKSALSRADLEASDISWVHAHGTGSQANDRAEGAAVKTVFGDGNPFVSSTKSIHGHSLGASGALETVLVVKAMQEEKVLKTAALTVPDSAILVNHPLENLHFRAAHVLKNTLGFGGNNASLILSREYPR
jgi:3-oxoacyl-[acyl-carrier-protein] synthase-1